MLMGGNGNDVLWGDAGTDRLTGGGGSDRFALVKATGTDSILDFEDGQDLLGLSGGLTFEQLSIAQNGSATSIGLTSTKEILVSLVGVQVANITQQDFTAI